MTRYIAIGLLLLVMVLLVVFRDKLKTLFTKDPAPAAAPNTQQQPNTQQNNTPAGLDNNKLLKKGVIAPEVGVLQNWIGATVDNNFGPQTEAKLQAKKGVTQITLATYGTIPDVNGNTSTGSWGDDDYSNWYDALPFSFLF